MAKASKRASFETNVMLSSIAYAISMRSNGSLCDPRKAPAICACVTVTGSSKNAWEMIAARTSAATSDA
ncbi:MAG: hypothetical protein SGJ03_07745 [Alphaproteobacteria bacterium]|nr:hypothetical protein [Alphaproteobacteria bacterium]